MTWNAITLTKPASLTGAASLAELQALATGVDSVMVHPFQYGVGEGSPMPTHLAFPNAVEALAIKLEEIKPQAATVLAVASSGHDSFASKLQALVDATDMLWLLTPQQRAALQAALEQQKWLVKEASPIPVLKRKTHTLLHIGKVAEIYQAKGCQLAKQESETAISDMATELANWQAAKDQHNSEVDSALDAVTVTNADAMAVSLTGGDLGNQLRSAGGPGPEMSLTMLLCFYGDDLSVINELLGA